MGGRVMAELALDQVDVTRPRKDCHLWPRVGTPAEERGPG